MQSPLSRLKGLLAKRRTIRARRRRVAELERDPVMMAEIREALESERLGLGVRFEDLRRSSPD